MKVYSAVIERDPQTGLFVGFVPGFPGAHSQAAALDELADNLREHIAMLLEDGEPQLESEFVRPERLHRLKFRGQASGSEASLGRRHSAPARVRGSGSAAARFSQAISRQCRALYDGSVSPWRRTRSDPLGGHL